MNEADEHGRKLVDKILQHVGYDDANEWKLLSPTMKTMLNWSFFQCVLPVQDDEGEGLLIEESGPN